MRKKFFSGLLMVVAIVAATSTFTSCKDTYADDMQETQGQIKDLNKLLDVLGTRYTELKDEINALKVAQQNCQTKCKEKQDSLQTLINDLTDAFNAFKNNTYTKAEVDAMINALKQRVQNLEDNKADNTQIDYLKGLIDALTARVATLEAGASITVDAYTKAQTDEKVQALQDQINNIKTDIVNLQATDALLQQQLDNLEPRVTALEARMTNAEGRIEFVKDSIIGLINDIETSLSNVKATADAAYDLAKDDSTEIAAIKNRLDDFLTKDEFNAYKAITANRLQDISDSLAYAYATSTAAYQYANANKVLIDSLFNLLSLVDPQFGNYYTKAQVDAKIDSLGQIADEAKELATKADELAEKAYKLADEAKTVAEEALNNATFAIDETERIEAAYKAADQALSDKIDALETELKNLIQALDDRLTKAEENLAQYISGILVQGTVNPVLGYLNTPFGISSSLLCSFYGENTGADVTFPTLDAAAAAAIGSFETISISNGDVIVDGGDKAYLGKVYTTINPNTVDFSGQTLTLETSAQNASKVTLEPLAVSTDELTFGYTRAANGFYEAEAYVSVDDVQSIKPNIDKEALKGIAKDVMNKIKDRSTSLNLQNIYKTFMEQISNVAPAYALKATWTDADAVEHSIFSQYCIAATAIQPASFEFLKDYSYPACKHISPLDLSMNIDYSQWSDIYANWYVMNGTTLVGFYATEAQADAAVAANPGSVKYDCAAFDALINDRVGAQVTGNIDALINQIKSQFESKVQDKLNNQFISRVNNLIDKIYNKLTALNDYLQPTMLYQTVEGKWFSLSDVKANPTPATAGAFVLDPTSRTAELLAPAYKKFVAVTDVAKVGGSETAQGGDAECQAVLDEANQPIFGNPAIANMKTIFSGSKEMILSVQSGYVYEITYTAIDYSGKVATKKFYVRVN